MNRTIIAIDNGTSGSVGILSPSGATFCDVPTKPALHYSKKGNTHQRIDAYELVMLLSPFTGSPCHAYVERPFTGSPMMINTMLLSARAYEAVVIALEQLGIGYETVDSKGWQSAMVPGVKGSANLKQASKLKGIQLYPSLAPYINKHGDADGLLMAHYYRNQQQ